MLQKEEHIVSDDKSVPSSAVRRIHQPSISDSTVRDSLVGTVRHLLKHPERLPGCADRAGVVLTLLYHSRNHTREMQQILIGKIATRKYLKHFRISEKKCADILADPDYISSRQIADPAQERYPGGIRVPGGAVAICGLTPDMDEAVVLAACWKIGLIDSSLVGKIIRTGREANKNPLVVWRLVDPI